MAKVELCNFSFLANSQEDPSTLFISYLDFLNEENVLEVDEFEEILVRLESGELINPFEVKEVNKENKAYGEIFQDYINVGIDEEKIKTYLKSVIQKENQTAKESNKTKEEVKEVFMPIKFGEINSGSSQGDFGIDYSFEVMITPVTHAHWESIFEKSLQFEDGEIFDLPKTNINLFSQAFFADKLSTTMGHKPVYEFHKIASGLDFSQAYKGILHKDGSSHELFTRRNFIEQEGYRLPTLDEQSLLLQKAIDYLGSDFDKLIDDYAYLVHNSNYSVHNTGEKKPFQIEGQYFYDVIGNVDETSLNIETEKNQWRTYEISWFTSSALSQSRGLWDASSRKDLIKGKSKFTGFRLVRTLKK